MKLLYLLLPLLTQVSVSSTWIDFSSVDVEKVLTPLTNWAWSYFNVIITFAWVIIAIRFIRLLSDKIKKN